MGLLPHFHGRCHCQIGTFFSNQWRHLRVTLSQRISDHSENGLDGKRSGFESDLMASLLRHAHSIPKDRIEREKSIEREGDD